MWPEAPAATRMRRAWASAAMTDYTILAPPRISQQTFARILAHKESPAAPVAARAYAAITHHGVDPALALAMFQHESSFGRYGAAVTRHNWGNLRRSPAFPSDHGFVRYPDWVDGAGDTARLLAIYGRNEIRPGRRTNTARTFPYVWAPSSDGNRPATYGDAIVRGIERFMLLDGGSSHNHVPTNGQHADVGTQRYVALVDHSRLRTAPNVGAAPVKWASAGWKADVSATLQGGFYDALGKHDSAWLRIVRLNGVALEHPLFSAAVLWSRA